jgi:hypothetical protein
MGAFDRSSKWLIERYGGALLRRAGVRHLTAWRALPAEIVQPGQLPGLIEAHLTGAPEPRQYILEIATYPEQRVQKQLSRDAVLVWLNRRALPEVLVLVLHPTGRLRVATSLHRTSPGGFTELRLRWRVVELWELPAEELLATQEPGLMPWVPLTRFAGSPGPVLQRCREGIEQRAPSLGLTSAARRPACWAGS